MSTKFSKERDIQLKKAELFDLYKEAAAVKQVKLAFSAKDHPQISYE